MQLTSTPSRRVGFTLVELLVALVLSAIAFAGLLALFQTIVRHSTLTLNTIRLEQDLRGTVSLMAGDLRRAGFWGNAAADIGTGANTNPFMDADTDITLNAARNCILFAYDKNGDGLLPLLGSVDDDERYGYRLYGDAIQSRLSSAYFSCTAPDSGWEDLTDPKNLIVTSLELTKNERAVDIDGTGPGLSSLVQREILITLEGQLLGDTSVTKRHTYQIKVRNDRFVP